MLVSRQQANMGHADRCSRSENILVRNLALANEGGNSTVSVVTSHPWSSVILREACASRAFPPVLVSVAIEVALVSLKQPFLSLSAIESRVREDFSWWLDDRSPSIV